MTAAAAPLSRGFDPDYFDYAPWCSLDPHRPNLRNPWTRDGFTWATNGHVLIRTGVNKLVGENERAPSPERVLAGFDAATNWKPLALRDLPEPTFCNVWVENFDAIGEPLMETKQNCQVATSVGIRGFNLDLRYARLIAALPECEISVGAQTKPAYFRFAGGIGAVMGVLWKYEVHVDLTEGDGLEPQP